MSGDPKHKDTLDALAQRRRAAEDVTPALMSAIIEQACARLPLLNATGKPATRITRLLQSGAWADALLALIEIELPDWTLRRLIYDDGEWLCALSRHPNMPVELDDTADAYHRIMPLAIVGAFLEARRRTIEVRKAQPSAAPRVSPISAHTVNCDNFA